MDPVTGATIAAAVGWTSIVAVVELPVARVVPPERLRTVGAVTLGVVGLSALGAPVPAASSLGLLTVGLVGAALERPLRNGVDLPHADEAGLPGCRLPTPDVASAPAPRLHRHGASDDGDAASGKADVDASTPTPFPVGVFGTRTWTPSPNGPNGRVMHVRGT